MDPTKLLSAHSWHTYSRSPLLLKQSLCWSWFKSLCKAHRALINMHLLRFSLSSFHETWLLQGNYWQPNSSHLQCNHDKCQKPWWHLQKVYFLLIHEVRRKNAAWKMHQLNKIQVQPELSFLQGLCNNEFSKADCRGEEQMEGAILLSRLLPLICRQGCC